MLINIKYIMSKNNKPKNYHYDLIDFYEVLGIEDRNMSTSEIRKKYVKLVVKYHPDKSKDADPKIFALIQRAWDCLGDEQKRKQYDFFFANEQKAKKGDHNNLKRGFDTFMDLKKNEEEDESHKKKAQINFKYASEEMDKKHNFNRKKYEEKAMDPKETSNRYSNLMLEREQQEIEFAQSRIFPESSKFNEDTLKKFNKIFDEYKHKTDKKGKSHIINNINGPTAWNNAFDEQMFTPLDSFDNVYGNDDDTGGLNYGNLNEFGDEIKVDMDDDDFDNIGEADYVTAHNLKGDDYAKDIEKKLREREMETQQLHNKKFEYCDADQDKSFMFTHEVGNMGTIEWDNDDDSELHDACNRLLELERNNRRI
ncbi:DnaJ domain protein [Catovirus CTV1]|uniref:DnaJ domain protein n=1 Tax=Catovirus CTV1 TaxID=1977631 RepID=A0A1V0SCB4_9VIRU|nr:DnaJ domain protein [Catovirus CTV1]